MTQGSNSVVIVNGKVVSGGRITEGKGPDVTETRSLPSYSAVRLNAPVEFHYSVSANRSLTVKAAANILPLLKTKMEGSTLVVELADSISSGQPLHIEATGPHVDAFAVNGAANLVLERVLGKTLAITVSGSGNVTAVGKVDRLKVNVFGSGAVDASGIQSVDVEVGCGGSGDVQVHATHSVEIDVAESGSVTISGKPPTRHVNKAGSGEVRFL